MYIFSKILVFFVALLYNKSGDFIMKTIDISDSLFVDFSVSNIIALNQKWQDSSSYTYSDKLRPDNGLILIKSGTFTYRFNDCTVFANPGDVVYIPKSSRYTVEFSSNGKSSIESILINFILTDKSGNEFVFENLPKKLISKKDFDIMSRFTFLSESYISENIPIKLNVMLYELIFEIVSKMQSDSKKAFSGCREYINSNILQKITVSELAKKYFMGETAFRKAFKTEFGMSPVKYINTIKISKACDMLKHSDMEICKISDILGFFDPAYFSKTFKKYTGLSPAEYKKRFL